MNTKNQIRLLDCTLRDGGHLNGGAFGEEVIKNVIEKLVAAKVDIIEAGFLWDRRYGTDTARYYTIEDVKRVLPADRGVSSFSLMADFIDLEHLEPCDGTVEYIRLSFKRHRLEWAVRTAGILMEKGYKVFINPVNCNVYSEEEYINVLRQVNTLKPYGFSIVDTFGVMRLRDLNYTYSIVENNLAPDITIGLHLHENLGLSYSLAQYFIRMASPKRKIVVDGSLLGMGRVPGNLCIEQIMDYLNNEYGSGYALEPVFDAIDDYIAPQKKATPWGYAIPYALSAKYHLHRTYAEFLMGKWKLRTSDIERILSTLDKEESELFNEQYIERVYRDYMSVEADDREDLAALGRELAGREILLVAPGIMIRKEKEKLLSYISRHRPVTVGVHCVMPEIPFDYVFYTNIKRYDVLRGGQPGVRKILTSNLLRYGMCDGGTYVLKYSRLAYHGEDFCDDSVMMALKLLKEIGVRRVSIAGFDGIAGGKGNFYIDSLSRNGVAPDYSDRVKAVLAGHYRDMEIRFITDSYYSDYKKEEKEDERYC